MRTITFYGLLIISLALAATAADDVVGKYICFGTHPYNAGRYGCEVEITRAGEVYRIRWAFEEGYGYGGVGVVKNGYLCVGYESHVGYGVALYEIEPDGVLDGALGLPGFKEIGTEKLHREETNRAGGETRE